MKKFISLFLVISMIMCNLNTGVVEALSSYGNEVKSFVNTLTKTEKEKTVGVEEDKGIETKTEQVPTNNEVDNTNVIGSENKETAQVSKNNQVEKYSYKNSSTYDNEGNVQQNIILIYNIETGKIYYYIKSDDIQELSLINEKITKNKNKINLNNVLTNDNLVKSNDILDPEEVTLVITGTGSYETIQFDNDDYYDIPFNIVFYQINGMHCSFSFENVKSIHVIGENTIENSSDDNTGLTYSFNGEDLDPLKIYNNSSFIVYNEDKDNINSNIFYSGDDFDESGDDSENSGDASKELGDSSIVNISFEENLSQDKKLILQPVNNDGISKKISIKKDYNVLSILLVSDSKNYILKEEGNSDIPYYYKVNNSDNGNNEISGRIKTRVSLNKNTNQDCYEVNNKSRVEVIDTKNYQSNYYLVDTLEEAINNCLNIESGDLEFIFLGNYNITPKDVETIKSYDKDTDGITFKTNVDDWTYLLNVDEDIELMANNSNKFSVTFNDIRFKYNSNDNWIYTNGRRLIFGENVKMEGVNYPSVSLGEKTNLLEDVDSVNDSSLIINSGTYGFVIGHGYSALQNIDITINGGIFNNEVIGVDGKIVKNTTLTINNGTFRKQVIGINVGTANSTTLTINNGTFRDNLIGINGGTANSATLTINNGTFYKTILGASSNSITEKFTLKGLFNRYLFSDNTTITNNQVQRDSSQLNGVNINNIFIKGGTFNKDSNLIGNPEGNAIINIDCNTITIPTISEFTKLVVGENRKTTLNVNQLDKGYSTGDLYLKNGSKISFKTGKETSKLNNIELYGKNNTLVLPTNTTINTTKDNVLINLSGKIKTNNNKLKIDVKSNKTPTSGMYLIKFKDKSNVEIESKYEISTGYYIRDIRDEEDSSGYVVLYPQTTFDLEYNLKDGKLYMIDKDSDSKEEAWWYTKDTTKDITLDTSTLYKYKGYDLYEPKNNVDRNLILTGTSSNKNIIVKNNLNNFNVVLDTIDLTDSIVNISNIKSLKLKGVNTINSINETNNIFTYTFIDNKTDDKISFENNTSYLKIFTKETTNPFSKYQGNCIDFKFFEPFKEERTVRLKNDSTVYQFKIPINTQRLGILVNSSTYNLYDGESGETGSSVYVSGNTDDKFTGEYKTSELYEYVRRANPVNQIKVEMPNEIYFGVNVEANKLDSINKNNWQEHFSVTELKVKNNSLVVQDQFRDKDGKVHNFVGKGNTNPDLDLGYMGVSSSRDMRNDIKLISKNQLDPNVEIDNIVGVRLALKLGNTPIDESKGISEYPLGNWVIPYNKEETIAIQPDFGNAGNFFNIDKNTVDILTLHSSHKFTFRFGLK